MRWQSLVCDWKFWYLIVFISPLIVNPWGLNPYEIPKQVFLILVIVFIVLYFIIAGRKIDFIFNKKIFLFACFWGLSLAVSTIFSIAPLESFWGSTERLQGLFTWILYFVHFFICLQIFKEKKFRELFLKLIVIIGLILSLYAILQHFGIDPLNISNINEASGRSFATIGQPSLLGQWLIFPFIILLIKIFDKHTVKSRLYDSLPLIVVGFALITTLNRASILGIICSFALFIFYKFRKKVSLKWLVVSAVILLIIALKLIEWGGFRSIDSRLNLIKPVAPLIQQNWLIGAGPETMYHTYQKVLDKSIYLTENLYDIPDRIHNETIQILLDQGIFGFILYLCLTVFLVKLFFDEKVFSFEESAVYFSIIAYFISVQFSFSTSVHTVTLLAMLAILLMNKLKFQTVKIMSFKNSPLVIVAKFLLLIFTIFYTYNGLAFLKADVFFQKGLDNYFAMNGNTVKFFDSALKLNNHSRYYLYHAANLLSVKEPGNPQLDVKLEGYLADLGKLTNYSYHYDLAMTNYLDRKKDFEKKDVYFSNASQKAPNWPFVWQQWGGDLFEREDYKGAVEKYENLMNLAPPYWTWKDKLDGLTFEDKEKYRLFRKNNELFYMAMHRLATAYGKVGKDEEAERINSYL